MNQSKIASLVIVFMCLVWILITYFPRNRSYPLIWVISVITIIVFILLVKEKEMGFFDYTELSWAFLIMWMTVLFAWIMFRHIHDPLSDLAFFVQGILLILLILTLGRGRDEEKIIRRG